MDKQLHLDNIKNVIIILTKKKKLNEYLSSLIDLSSKHSTFMISLDKELYSCYIFYIKGIKSQLVNSVLYSSFNVYKEFDKCLVIEWKDDIDFFSIYGVFDSSDLRFAFDDTHSTLNEKGIFIKALLGDVTSLKVVDSWLYTVLGFSSEATLSFMNKLRNQDIEELFYGGS